MVTWMPFLLVAGQTSIESTAPRAVERRTDAVLRWNEEALETIRQTRTVPPKAARALALMHAAIYDSTNTIYQTHTSYRVGLRAVAEIDAIAATCSAAEHVMSEIFPSRTRHFRSVRDDLLALLADGPAQKRGIELGLHVAKQIMHERKDDFGTGDYLTPAAVGIWRPTPPTNSPALLPNWGNLRPFAISDKKAFRPVDPPELTSEQYAKEFHQVKSLGAIDSGSRTADQTLIALFWDDGVGTCTPPGHWNLIAREVSQMRKLTLAENARLFALLNLALADASLCCWDCKYRFKFWRPITAIHQADRDANDATVKDPKWKPLLVTPPFPSYTSGHSTFSGAASAILAGYFKDDAIAFSIGSDGLVAHRRHYKGFREAGEEAGMSRIYGGIHFECDNQEGLKIGRAIAEEILRKRLVPVGDSGRRAVSPAAPRRIGYASGRREEPPFYTVPVEHHAVTFVSPERFRGETGEASLYPRSLLLPCRGRS